MDFGRLLERSAAKYPDKTAVVFGEQRFSYKEMEQRVNCLANALKDMGLPRHARIGIISQNCHQYLETLFACSKAELVSANFNWRLKEDELCRLITDAAIKVIFIHSRFISLISYLEKQDKAFIFVIIDKKITNYLYYEDLMAGKSGEAPARNIEDGDVLLQVYTSGTTWIPKGVMLTHKNVVSHAMSNAIEAGYTPDTVFLFLMPMFHVAASAAFVTVLVGGCVVILDHFEPESYAASIERERVTMIGAPPTVVAKLLEIHAAQNYDLTSLETVTYGSAPMPPVVITEAVKCLHCRFVQYFGMSEMSPTICTLGPEDHRCQVPDCPPHRLFSVGKPCIGAEVKVVDADGKECAPGVVGEIIARGDHMMKGYYKLPELTSQVIVDGWYYTNDMGYFDGEGFLYLAGRKSDMIISGGENIYPDEVEACIKELKEDVEDAAVIAVKDRVWGEIVQAVVVRKAGSEITGQDIIDHCRRRIASYKKPRRVVFTDRLPKSANGKTIRHILREQYSQEAAVQDKPKA